MLPIENYRAHPAVNVSTLKALYNPKWIKWKLDNPDAEDEEKSHFRIGGALDTLLTNKNAFNDIYYIGDTDRVGGLMKIFIDNLPLDLDESSPQDLYQDAYLASGYVIPMSLAIKRLWETGSNKDYYVARKRAKGKSVVTKQEYEIVNSCYEQIMNNAYVRKYFINTDPNVRLLHQAVVLFEYNGIQCKGALDGLVVDYKNKKLKPFDLKTTAKNVKAFPQVFLTYGYYLQGAYYVEGLKKVLQSEEFIDYYNLPNEVKDYEVENMRFIVIEKKKTTMSMPPFIYTTTEELHDVGISGGTINNKNYKGFAEYLEDWKYHKTMNFWEYSREYIQNKGEFEINPFNHEFL